MDSLARLLWDARQFGFTVPRDELAGIDTLAAAYGIQARQVLYSGQEIGGWKLGATAAPVQALIGLDAPFSAPLFAGAIAGSGAEVAVFADHGPRIETEVALKLGARLPPRPEPYTREEAAEAVASAWASFEIVGIRFEGGPKDGGPLVVADGGINAGAVVGGEIPLYALARGLEVTVTKNGEEIARSTADAMTWEDHLDTLIWLAEHQDQLPRRLQVGDIVQTGTVAGLLDAAPGDEFRADFGGVAEVSVFLTEE